MRKLNTEKVVCRMLAEALAAYGVRHVVTSPGSRNAPLLMALYRNDELNTISVIDERCAAFEALGMADIYREPIALCCTSGSALLNYGPALAEAYYRQIPIIAVTADRPSEWIDQADSQTIRQPNALNNIVKACVTLSDKQTSSEELWHVNRKLNDVLYAATSGPRRPVHINIHLSSPLTNEVEIDDDNPIFRKINMIAPSKIIPVEVVRNLAGLLVGRQVLFVAGIHPPDATLNRAMSTLSQIEGFTVVDEGLANLRGGEIINFTDTTLGNPDVLITYGGAIVSSHLKNYLRNCGSIREHWHISETEYVIDTFQKLTTRIEFPPEGFFPRLAGAIGHHTRIGDFKIKKAVTPKCAHKEEGEGEWNSQTAIRLLLSLIPAQWNLQLGNGMAVRYALPFVMGRFHRVTSNRGVSGIDGCISTAIGASIAYDKPTCLIVGDMSAQYDLGAFASNQITPKLKIALLDNGGGEIFRRVATTRNLIEREPLIAGGVNLPVAKLAEAFGFHYLVVSNQTSFARAVKEFVAEKERPCILHIIIDNP